MSLRGAIEAMRAKVPPVLPAANHGEPLEATEIKAVPPVPWVPPEKTKIETHPIQRTGPRPGSPNGEIVDSRVSREPGNPVAVKPTRRAVVRFALIGNQGGGSLLGDFGDTVADLAGELERRYGDRLANLGANP